LSELSEAQEQIDAAFKHWPDVNLGNASSQNWFDWVFPRIPPSEATEPLANQTNFPAQ